MAAWFKRKPKATNTAEGLDEMGTLALRGCLELQLTQGEPTRPIRTRSLAENSKSKQPVYNNSVVFQPGWKRSVDANDMVSLATTEQPTPKKYQPKIGAKQSSFKAPTALTVNTDNVKLGRSVSFADQVTKNTPAPFVVDILIDRATNLHLLKQNTPQPQAQSTPPTLAMWCSVSLFASDHQLTPIATPNRNQAWIWGTRCQFSCVDEATTVAIRVYNHPVHDYVNLILHFTFPLGQTPLGKAVKQTIAIAENVTFSITIRRTNAGESSPGAPGKTLTDAQTLRALLTSPIQAKKSKNKKKSAHTTTTAATASNPTANKPTGKSKNTAKSSRKKQPKDKALAKAHLRRSSSMDDIPSKPPKLSDLPISVKKSSSHDVLSRHKHHHPTKPVVIASAVWA